MSTLVTLVLSSRATPCLCLMLELCRAGYFLLPVEVPAQNKSIRPHAQCSLCLFLRQCHGGVRSGIPPPMEMACICLPCFDCKDAWEPYSTTPQAVSGRPASWLESGCHCGAAELGTGGENTTGACGSVAGMT